MKGNKLPEVAARCYVDFCNASAYLTGNGTSIFSPFLDEIEKELKVNLVVDRIYE